MTTGATGLVELADQIQKYWSPLMTKTLKEDTLLVNLTNKDYEGQIQRGGDTVYVSQIKDITGENKDIAAGEGSTFNTEKLTTQRIAIVADKRAIAAVEVEELAEIQSQLGQEKSEIRNKLVEAIERQMNDYAYSLVSPSASTPDHVLTSVSDMNAAQMRAIRVLAGQAKWPKNEPWYALLDPAYYGDIMDDSTLANADYTGGEDRPVINGQVAAKRMGFNILEDNSRATQKGLFFYPGFMHTVMQTQLRFKISDLHPLGQLGYKLSCDIIYGMKLGIDGDVKHITAEN